MKTSLQHLPQNKQTELDLIKRTILDFCPEIEMIILFGSYARGDWVDDIYQEDHITYKYESDYDLLIVFDNEQQAHNINLKQKLEKLIRESGIQTRFSLILHSVSFLNKKIACGNYFFCDIKKEGIMLYDSHNCELEECKELNVAERQKHAQEDFEQWFEMAVEFLIDFRNAFNRNSYKNAVFMLHQSAERFYHSIILVHTGYKPKSHNLEELNGKARTINAEIAKVFPCKSKEEKVWFDLLCKAYIDSRYDKDFAIKKEELEYLAQRVELLQEITERICKEKIKSFSE